ncbi:LacI family DNA-binding transcriptional regulator [Fredinandcohnia humi]
MVTIKEIAQKAGVSISTVSRVLNNEHSRLFSDETKRKIFKTAKDLSYQKKSFQGLTTYKVVILHGYNEQEELENFYYMSIKSGIENRCRHHSIQITECFQNNYKSLIDTNFKGLIILGRYDLNLVKEIHSITKNIVILDAPYDEEEYDLVVVNLERATKKVLDYFLDKGHKNIGYIGGNVVLNDKESIMDQREIAFRRYLEEKGLFNELFIYIGTFSVNDGYLLMKKAIRELGKKLPTAFFAGSDTIAIGALRALLEEGIAVPNRVNLIGINDINISKYIYPSLSTIKVNTEAMGETAVDLLLERIDGRKIPKKVYMATELIIRNSSF